MDKVFLKSEILEIDGEKLFVASTDATDRHGEIVVQEGMDIKSYLKNPVVLAYHDHKQPPLGIAEKVGFKKIDGKKVLVYDPIFHGKTAISSLYKEWKEAGVRLASSIGFIPKEMEKNKITKSELLEISIVNVPANPEALSLAYAKGFERDVIKEAMGKGFIKAEQKLEIQKLKEENEALVKLNESLNEKLASLETPKAATKGRDPKLVKRDLAIKAVNRAIEQLNRTVKETE